MAGPEVVLLTGGSGYLGGLIAAALLAKTDRHVYLPVRAHHADDELIEGLSWGVRTMGGPWDPDWQHRLHRIALPGIEDLSPLEEQLSGLRVAEIVHCAGCLDYFDRPLLEAVNIGFTSRMLELGRRLGVRRFTYLSTAFSSGYLDVLSPETVHVDPPRDPTDYTRTKREAERIVAGSGLPYLILRPSIVIGTSESGVYTGKRYGVYQLWNGLERLMCKKWSPVLHLVGPRQPVNMIHQDAFQQAFLAAWQGLPDDSVAHLSSRNHSLPTLRDFWELWNRDVSRAQELVFYDRVEDVPLRQIDTRQRAFLSLAWVNLQIASHPWRFEDGHLQRLREAGLAMTDVTVSTLEICQRRFVGESPTIQDFLARTSGEAAVQQSAEAR